MQITVIPSKTSGTISAIASKSVAHRALICAAFADAPSLIRCEETNEDIIATVNCLRALGADIDEKLSYFKVTPVKEHNEFALLPCNESGSTLRFLLPVCAALGGEFTFEMKGRLKDRPLSPLKELLTDNGISFSKISDDGKLTVSGKLSGSSYEIDGNVSSQFITGLLLAFTISKTNAVLKINKTLESAPYVNITLDTLSAFGVKIATDGNKYIVPQNASLRATPTLSIEGDWSNAAFPLALGILGKGAITVSGLNEHSSQGDKKIIEILSAFGGKIEINEGVYTAYPSSLSAIELDASQIPDLVPIIATVASVAKGKTVIRGASRLRLKESDRLFSISSVLSKIGANISVTEDGLEIIGVPSLKGGRVSSFNDHRIAMSLAVASVLCKEPIIIEGADAVNKSYPSFWQDFASLGATLY